jgi:hypothetical protein
LQVDQTMAWLRQLVVAIVCNACTAPLPDTTHAAVARADVCSPLTVPGVLPRVSFA